MTNQAATRRPLRRWVLVAAGLAVAVLALLGWGLAQRTDPRDLVVAYLDAIAAGDVEAANALATDGVWTGAGLPDPGSTDDADPVTAVQVDRDGRPTSVSPLVGADYEALGYDVAYEVAGQRVEDSVYVEQTGGWWLWAEWRIRDTLAQPVRIIVQSPLEEVDVAIGSATTAARSGRSTTEVPLYPGSYQVVPDPTAVLPLAPQPLLVADEVAYVELEATPEQLRADAEGQLLAAAREALDVCTGTTADQLVCDGDAFAVADDADDAGAPVTWRVDGGVVLDGETRFQQTWRTSATVVATWTDVDGAAREQRYTFLGQASVVAITPDAVQVLAQWTRAVDA